MKKHDEGYVLPLVMVVLAVLSLVAATLMASSLRNLQSQQASIDRMVDKYAAEGAVEIVVAELMNQKVEEIVGSTIASSAKVKAECDEVSCNIQETNGKYTASVTSRDKSIKVTCELNLQVKNNIIEAISFTSYDITNIGGAG